MVGPNAMQQVSDHYKAVEASAQARLAFIRRTYTHLAGAIAAFVLLEVIFFNTGIAEKVWGVVANVNWLIFLGAFMLVAFIATRFAHSDASPSAQYFGLSLYVVAEALIFIPLLYAATHLCNDPGLLPSAVITTLLVFTGLTMAVFITGRDFSFLGTILTTLAFLGLGLIVCGAIFGLSLGTWFSFGMAAVAAGFILYDTSNVLHHYRTDQHVAASLSLFASIALLFWYILLIFMDND